ncbi:unnamed protein product [Musa textilis]
MNNDPNGAVVDRPRWAASGDEHRVHSSKRTRLLHPLHLRNLLCLRAKRHRDANHVFPTEPAAVVALQPGLQATAIEALPSMVFRCERHKQGVECAVCLGELSEGEEVRLLLGCKHAFHLRCIDMWFFSHSTCPLCRSPVVLDTPEPANSGAEASPLSSSSSVGGLGSQGVSSSSSGSCAVVAETAARHEGSRDGLQ